MAEARLASLIQRLSQGCKNSDGFGTFTSNFYDTAWLAMITQPAAAGGSELLFPRCLSHLIQGQGNYGGWGRTEWPVDGILSSLASLLCLLKHRSDKVNLDLSEKDLDERVARARSFIQSELQAWNVSSTIHVGFEILVPALLSYVADQGVVFDFPGKDRLNELNLAKTARFKAEMLYGKHTTTLVHSLEAFVGVIDFNKTKHHLVNGSMFGSPSATAAYLMNVDLWDHSAENYLRSVVSRTNDTDGIPSAFPSGIFECSWVLSTLLSSDVDMETLNNYGARDTIEFLSGTLHAQNNTVGFSSGLLPDADDTAKSLYVLNRSGRSAHSNELISMFSSSKYFRTYHLETKPSFSANCNILIALLSHEDLGRYTTEIQKAATFLVDLAEQSSLSDKWNLSPVYSYMLLAQALKDLLLRWDKGHLPKLSTELVRQRIPIVSLEILRYLLASQKKDGSWSGLREETAYAVLGLSYISQLPLPIELQKELSQARDRGRRYILDRMDAWEQPEHLWVEKVSYGSPMLSESYCVSAVLDCQKPSKSTERLSSIFDVPKSFAKKLEKLTSALPLLQRKQPQQLEISIAESYLYFQRLQANPSDMFPKTERSENKYLSIVPFTWIVCNSINGSKLSSRQLWDMMEFSVRIYLIDEYVESQLALLSDPSLNVLDFIIKEHCGCSDLRTQWPHTKFEERQAPFAATGLLTPRSSISSASSSSEGFNAGDLSSVSRIIELFIARVVNRPVVLAAGEFQRQALSHELCDFLLAHIQHIRDNKALAHQRKTASRPPSPPSSMKRETRETGDDADFPCYRSAGISYRAWLASVGAVDTSCSFAFAYYTCLLGKDDDESPINGTHDRHQVSTLIAHLAAMCRQYNDAGSVRRDLDEGNVNGLNFPEFHTAELKAMAVKTGLSHSELARRTMLDMAEDERAHLELALKRLERTVDERMLSAVHSFVDVTDLYGQLYIIEDFTNRVK